jgi:hypothetical protein
MFAKTKQQVRQARAVRAMTETQEIFSDKTKFPRGPVHHTVLLLKLQILNDENPNIVVSMQDSPA